MSDQLNNNLIRFIKKMLKSSKPQSWNTPPDSVFDNALIEIAAQNQGRKRKKTRRAIAVLIATGFLGAAFIFQLKVNQMNQKIENLEGMIAADDQENIESGALPTIEIGAAAVTSSGKGQIMTKTLDAGYKAGTDLIIGSKTKGQFSGLEIETSSVKMAHPAEVFQPIKNQIQLPDNGNAEGVINPHIENAPNETADLRQNYHFHMLDSRPALVRGYSPTLTVLPQSGAPGIPGSRKLAIGVSMGANFSTLVMKGGGGSSILTEYDKFYSGFSVDGMVEYKLSNRWSAVFTLSYHQLKSQSRSQLNTAYDSANETFDNSGSAMYSAMGNIETPLGDHGTVFQFYTASLTAQDGDIITYMTDIDQSLNVLSASLGGRYTPVQIRNTEMFVGFGADFSNELNSSNTMQTETYMGKQLIGGSVERPDELSKHAFNYFSLYGEVGGRFVVGKRTDLVTTLRYTRSLSSLRTAGTNEPRTFVSQISPSIGINYYLK